MDAELERFKTEINLIDYLQNLGYEIDKNKSSRKSAVLKNGSEVLVVSRNSNQHYVYFNPENSRDSGTIIDFIQKRTGKNLGQVRKDLRAYLNGYSPSEHLTPTNQNDIREMYQKAEYFTKVWENLDELNDVWVLYDDIREISRKTIKSNEYIKKDNENNYYFPIFNKNGNIAGIYKTDNEMKQKQFLKGSIKGIWVNKKLNKNIKSIVITESPIDSLSLQELIKIDAVQGKEEKILHVATLGRLGEEAKKALETVFRKLPDAKVIIATDDDIAGAEIAKEIAQIAKKTGNYCKRAGFFTEYGSKDMNEYLEFVKSLQNPFSKNYERKFK